MWNNGFFVISLDFELYWGVCDVISKEKFESQIIGARKAIPQLLELFKKYDIHATWGTVGLLFADNFAELKAYSPNKKPQYLIENRSAYNHFNDVGESEDTDIFHYASKIIENIKQYDNQEIASHTFSHYYCKEKGQNAETFKQDLLSAQKIALDKQNIRLSSLILPRNHFNSDYLDVVKECGFTAIRGNHPHYAFNNSTLLARIIRLIDSYVNICGMKCFNQSECFYDGFVDIKASRFFRKYSPKLKLLEPLKIRCIKRQMLYAAKKNKLFHLWWHPHNFGVNTDANLKQIEEILKYYRVLNEKYNFSSKNMKQMEEECLK